MAEIDLTQFESHLEIRPLRPSDFEALIALQSRCFPGMPTWNRELFDSQLQVFPEGQICITYDGALVASSSSLILDYDLYSDWHDWKRVADSGYIRNHDPNGNVLYGIEIMVDPEHRGMRLARRLYEARKRLVRERNLRGIVIGGRIPGYKNDREEMTAHEYVETVESKAIYDPVLTTQLANGFELRELIPDYLPTDQESAGWATHMEWVNVEYRPFKKRAMNAVQVVRFAAVQYQVRSIRSFEEFERQCQFFIDAAAD